MASRRSSPTGDLTDVPGVLVGHWTNTEAATGCTVVTFEDSAGAVAAVDVRGAAPGTRETDLLAPWATVQRVHAVVLSGGSAFGLDSASGVVSELAKRGIGVATTAAVVPIVPAAVLYDLAVGDSNTRPDAQAGSTAYRAALAGRRCGSGRIGAGTGATVGKLFGAPRSGGLGCASLRVAGEAENGPWSVGAVVAVNALGDVIDGSGQVVAGDETVEKLLAGQPTGAPENQNTTLAVVATDAPVTKTQAHRIAQVAHDGFAQAIEPVHTVYDGDAIFVVSTAATPTGVSDVELLRLQTAAVQVVAASIRRAVEPREETSP